MTARPLGLRRLVVAGAGVRGHRHADPERLLRVASVRAGGGGTGTDSLSFHWPQDRLPVRIWVEDAAEPPGERPGGDRRLATGFLYGEFAARW